MTPNEAGPRNRSGSQDGGGRRARARPARQRAHAQQGGGAGFRYLLAPERRFEWTDGALPALAGGKDAGGQVDPDLLFRLVVPEDRETLVMAMAGGDRPVTLRIRRPEGSSVTLEADSRVVTDSAADLVAVEGRLRQTSAGTRAGEAIKLPPPPGDLEDIADQVAAAALTLDGADQASVILLVSATEMRRIGYAAGFASPSARGDLLPVSRVSYLSARALRGPWLERWVARPEDGTYGEALRDAGVRAVLYVPIGPVGVPRALLSILSARRDGLARLAGNLGAALQLAEVARARLMPHIEASDDERDARDALLGITTRRILSPLYQPIVSLEDGLVVGYESDIAFANGSDPGRRFAAAHRFGLGTALEEAALAAALAGAGHLPDACWLSVGVSPELLLESDFLGRFLQGYGRPIVLLVSEMHDVPDHDAVRARVEELGPDVHLGVDHVGNGEADYGHLVGLHPRFAKLAPRLVRRIESDARRQTVLKGLVNLLRASGCQLVADGVETQAERLTLLRLGVRLGSGYLLGGPSEAVLWAERRPRRDDAEQST